MTVPTAPADAPEPRPPLRVDLGDDGAVLVDGRHFAVNAETAREFATYQVEQTDDPDWEPRDGAMGRAVLDFLNAADRRAAHAEQVGPPVTGPVPGPPARPRVRLRTEVEVDGLPSVDLAVYVHPSAVDTATAVTAAARALHDAALAALHVLVVEPADPAGGAS